MPILIALLAFGAVSLLVLGLTMKTERQIMHERMQRQLYGASETPTSLEVEMNAPFAERILHPLLNRLAVLALRFTPGGALRALDARLTTAGRPLGLEAREFIGLRLLSIGAMVLVGIAVAPHFGGTALLKLALLVVFAFIGIILPDYLLQSVINTRQMKIRKVLADTLDLLTVSMEAGLSLDEAMLKVVEKFQGPLSEEMNRALHEMQIGKLRVDALRDMAKRAQVAELTAFVAAVCQADMLGISIVKVLRVQGETLRVQRSQRARETAAKVPVKMLFPLVFFIFPAIFVVILGPGAIQIAKSFTVLK